MTTIDDPMASFGTAGWRGAFDHSPIGAAVVELDGTIALVNVPLARIVGREDLVGQSIDELADTDERLTDLPEWAELVAGTRTAYDGERRFRDVRGRQLMVRLSIAGIHDDEGHLHGLVLQAHDVTSAREAEIALASRAINDDLTGLPNRWLTREWLARALAERPAAQVGVLSVDIDRLAAVNERLGNEAGDRVIAEVARRLRAAVDEDDLVGRISGDGFLVVCEGVSGTDLAEAGDAVVRAMADLVQLGTTRHGVSVCVGAATGVPGGDADDLLLRADMALARAKRSGGAAVAVFDADHDRGMAFTDLELEWQMRESVGAGELRAHYQPIVSLPGRQLTGYEALVRWVHAERGLLLPESFLGMAESNGLIAPIGAWMLQQAMRDALAVMPPDVSVSVNASPLQLARAGFVESVAAELAETGLAPRRLQLEITETALLHAGPSLLADMAALSAMGVRIALDDFGTGYSSLSLLHDLPVDTVKIDRSFVAPLLTDRRSRAMVRAVLGMCADLGVDSVAEGVEDEAQASMLVDMGCRRAQGFLFGRPEPLS